MATLASLKPEFWSNELQKTLFVENTALFLAGNDGQSMLSASGRKYHKPIISKPSTGTYTPYTDITFNQMNSSDQELEVDTFKYAAVEIDDTDVKQDLYNAGSFAAMSVQKQLNNLLEQAFLAKVTDAATYLDAANVGGSAGSNIVVTPSNASELFTAAHTSLDMVDAPMTNRIAVVGAHTLGTLRNTKAQRETALGDTVLANGIVGPWQGWLVVYNNNLPYTAVLTMATNPTDGDTATIAGVTYTFRATLGSTAGSIHIASTVDITRANWAEAINDPYTTEAEDTDTGYVALSDEDAFVIHEKRRITATNSNGADTLTITGFGDIVVSETFTAAGNVWGSQRQDSWFGIRGATDLVVQMPTNVEITRKEKGFADYVKALEGFGVKTFADGARLLRQVKIDASGWR